MTEKLYYIDSHLNRFEAVVTGCEETKGGWAVLKDGKPLVDRIFFGGTKGRVPSKLHRTFQQLPDGTKVWNDQQNKYGLRTSVTLQLQQNGEDLLHELVTYALSDMPFSQKGQRPCHATKNGPVRKYNAILRRNVRTAGALTFPMLRTEGYRFSIRSKKPWMPPSSFAIRSISSCDMPFVIS